MSVSTTMSEVVASRIAKGLRRDGATIREIAIALYNQGYVRPSGLRLTTLDVMRLLDQ